MTQKQSLKLFEERNVRTIWDDTQEKWYFSVVDVIQVLAENDYQTALCATPRLYTLHPKQ